MSQQSKIARPKRVMPTELELTRARIALKPVTQVSLGPIDTSGRELKRQGKITPKTGHEFADMATSMRRGITQMKASFNENMGVDAHLSTYARSSMNEWARRTTNVLQGHTGAAAYVEQATRSIYDNWRAQGTEYTPQEKRGKAINTLQSLVDTSAQSAKTRVNVYDQATKLTPDKMAKHHGASLSSGGKLDALENFAYRINPEKSRHKAPSGKMSRLSLNIDMEAAPAMVQRLGKVVKDEPGLVRQSKIMGPATIGSRVDDAVVYLGQEPNVENAKRIDKALSQGIAGPKMTAAPPGMESLSPISSYAEYMPGTSSSHGSNRGAMVHEVVKQKLAGSTTSTHELMGKSLEKAGYNPAQPSRIQSSTQTHLKQALAKRRSGMGYEK